MDDNALPCHWHNIIEYGLVLSGQSYFGKMFRQKYGMSPSEYRKVEKHYADGTADAFQISRLRHYT